ncbi:phytanoyl-dioxygenase family protein [Ilyonectria robusta]|uniref:phytanoyl-dioxygenase family protein n=1 Tax=Ilyonectria robusta TaxID=1079257 RepID=UPI001E8E6533|nr:phytanoyl-dioxygenase family protein [Ilyonectria robusta]KAH8661731.1 phytanoyl-dioxygenase family protein [Ilyonectria robusta]
MPATSKESSPLDKVVVDSFDAATAAVEDVLDSLKRNGGCVIKNFMSLEDVDQVISDVHPYLEADEPWEGDFFPKETRRVFGLAAKSPLYMEKIPGNPLYNSVCQKFLSTETTTWVGNKQVTDISPPQINSAVVISIGPGASAQPLHRDDSLHHNKKPQVTLKEYTMSRETAVGVFVAGTKSTKANGATRFIPGSHMDESLSGPGDENKVVYAELEKGDAFFMLASCYHGGSANTTTDQMRVIFGMFMTRGYLRQEENQFLANPMDKVQKLPIQTQKLLGYSVSAPFLGWVDLKDPIHVLNGETGTYDLDPALAAAPVPES